MGAPEDRIVHDVEDAHLGYAALFTLSPCATPSVLPSRQDTVGMICAMSTWALYWLAMFMIESSNDSDR